MIQTATNQIQGLWIDKQTGKLKNKRGEISNFNKGELDQKIIKISCKRNNQNTYR